MVITYDAHGNAVRIEYRNEDNGLANGAQGYARAALSYDRFGELEAVSYTDAEGIPVVLAN